MFERQKRRDERVRRFGSPTFLHTFGALATGVDEAVVVATRFPLAQKYEPLTRCVITNNSTQFVALEVNGKAFYRIPAGVIVTITDEPIWEIRITNSDSGTAGAGLILASFSRPPLNADQAARNG
jgi:hypothetical protein